MPAGFKDSSGKQIVRKMLDTSILKHYYNKWRSLYFYLGLPGKDAIDVKLWRNMIRRVIAFETENDDPKTLRKDITELNRNLALLKFDRFNVFCGFFEEVLLSGRDYDGQDFKQDELVTLYNLDFCNSITGKIDSNEGRKCLRFEALRVLLSIQNQILAGSHPKRFIVFLTVLDSIHTVELKRFLKVDSSAPVDRFNQASINVRQVAGTAIQRHTLLTKSFVYNTLRTYFLGHGISAYFYPMVRYTGASATSHMLHFPVVCSFTSAETAYAVEVQTPESFLRSKSYLVQGNQLVVSPLGEVENSDVDIFHHPDI